MSVSTRMKISSLKQTNTPVKPNSIGLSSSLMSFVFSIWFIIHVFEIFLITICVLRLVQKASNSSQTVVEVQTEKKIVLTLNSWLAIKKNECFFRVNRFVNQKKKKKTPSVNRFFTVFSSFVFVRLVGKSTVDMRVSSLIQLPREFLRRETREEKREKRRWENLDKIFLLYSNRMTKRD